MHGASGRILQAVAKTIFPPLRVVGLTYTGLAGMVLLVLVMGVGLTPVVPALEQAAEPARQAVSSFIQPPSDVVVTLFGGPSVHMPSPRLFSPTVTITVTVQDAELDVLAEESALEAPTAEPRVYTIRPQSAAPTPPVEEVLVEDDDPITEIVQPSAARPLVVQPAEPVVLQIASEAPPQALPTPAPTETPLQLKARLKAENRAAIDANKAAQARAKAEAEDANRAAIDALKAAAKATATATPVSTPTAVPAEAAKAATATPTANVATSTPTQTKAQLEAANRAAIDAAKRAKSQSRGNATPAATSTTTAGPTPRASAPTAQPTAAPPSPGQDVASPASHATEAQPTAPSTLLDAAQITDDGQLDEAPVNQALIPSSDCEPG